MNQNVKKSFDVVRKITTLSIMCVLFLVVIGCEKTNEHEEPEITEVFTSRFGIFNISSSYNPDRFLMFGNISLGFNVEPINLPEEFQQQGIRVQATVGLIGEETNEHGNPFVKIKKIQETDILDGRFIVRTNSNGGYVLHRDKWNGFGYDLLPICIRMIPTNLPEEFQKDGLRVQVAFRHIGEREPGEGFFYFIAEIVEIHKNQNL